jgi:hypothetical protein
MSAEQADAVTFSNVGEWGGTFNRDQLWLKTMTDTKYYGWNQPWNLGANSINSSQPHLWFDGSGANNGTGVSLDADTIAMGPIYKSEGDPDWRMVSWYSVGTGTGAGTVVFTPTGGNVNATKLATTWSNATPVSGATGCGAFNSRYSAGVNHANGYIYQMGSGDSPTFGQGNSNKAVIRAAIYKLQKNGTVTCMAGVSEMYPAGGAGDSIVQQWNARTGQNEAGTGNSWSASSGMAVDANGDIYTMVKSGGRIHALVRITVPHKANGDPEPNTDVNQWTYSIVQTWTQTTTDSKIFGNAFSNGALYTLHANGDVWRWDTLAGTVTKLGTTFASSNHGPMDLAASQAPPVIAGTVYNDVNGDGDISGDPVLADRYLELYQGNAASGSTTWTKRGEVKTDDQGRYNALLNSTNSEYIVRLKQPTINGLNAAQTYASAGQFYGEGVSSGEFNTLTAYCSQGAGSNYAPMTASGVCRGARADGVDALNVAQGQTGNPFAASGGAAILSKAQITTDQAVVQADFGITVAASWGDAPDSYKTTNAAGGPYANPLGGAGNYLRLGDAAGVYADGQPSAQANAHPTDDGLEIAPLVAGQSDQDRTWAPAQSQIMVAGQSYRFRARAGGDSAAVAASTLKAWISSVNSSGAVSSTFDTGLLGQGGSCSATPDASGYVYCSYTAGTGLPASKLAPVYVRARVSDDSTITATSRPGSNPNTAWVSLGEVEDYQLGVGDAVVRLQARTLGGVAANVNLSLGNVSSAPPSTTTDLIATNAAGTFAASTAGHAVSNRAAAVTISTTGVGAAGASGMNGWKLGTRSGASSEPIDTYCLESATSAPVTVQVNAASGAVTIPANQTARDITCYLTYIPQADFTTSTITAVPSDNFADADRLPVGTGASLVTLDVKGRVRDASGNWVDAPVAGDEVRLTLAPTPGSGSVASGGVIQYSTDSGATWTPAGQEYVCALGADGDCEYPVRVVATRTGGYNLAAQLDSSYIKKLGGSATDTDPVQIWFKSGSVAGGAGTINITDTSDKKANHGVAATPDSYQLDIQLEDQWGNPTTGVPASEFTLTCANSPATPNTDCPAAVGVVFGPVVEDGANPGHYFAQVYSTKIGVKHIGVRVNGITAALAKVGAPTQRYAPATFIPGPVSQDNSSFTVTTSGYRETSVGNPDQAQFYHLGLVVLRDANDNPVTGAGTVSYPRLTWNSSAPPASSVQITERTGGGEEGTYLVKIWSGVEATYSNTQVRVQNSASDSFSLWQGQVYSFKAVGPTPNDSFMTITDNPGMKANYQAPGTTMADWGIQVIYVTLRNGLNNPITTAHGALRVNTPNHGQTPPGLYYSDPTGLGPGIMGCNGGLVNGLCTTGVYSVAVWSKTAGNHQVTVAYAPTAGIPEWLVPRLGSNPAEYYVVAKFVAPPVSPNDSVFVLGDPVNNPGESLDDQDDWDNPLDEPDGGNSVDHVAGTPFHPNVRVWDAGRMNPIEGQSVTLQLSGAGCAATFNNGSTTYSASTSATGKMGAVVNSATPTQCTITAKVNVSGTDVEIPGSPKTLTWVQSQIDYSASHFTVSTSPVVADNVDTGTVVAYLRGMNNLPITDAAADLLPRGEADSGLTFGTFTHNAANPGYYTATFTGTKTGDKVVDVAAVGIDLAVTQPNGNDIAHMVAGPASADHSWLIQPGGTAKANGTETLQVRAHLKDAFGNNAAGTVRFSYPAGVRAIVGAQVRPGPDYVDVPAVNGYATLTVSSLTANTYGITGGVLTGSVVTPIQKVKNAAETSDLSNGGVAEVVFVSDAPSPTLSVLTIPTAAGTPPATVLADGQAKHRAEVLVKDDMGNLVTDGNASVVFSYQYTDNHSQLVTGSSAAVPTDVNGVAAWEFPSTVATTWTIRAYLVSPAAEVSGSPKTAGFHPGPADPGNTTASLQVGQNTVRADGQAYVPAWMTVQDAFGNPIPNDTTGCGFELVYQGDSGAKFDNASTGAKTASGVNADASGVCQVLIRSYYSGAFPVKGIFGASESQPPRPNANFSNVVVDPYTSDFSVAPWSGNHSPSKVVADNQDAYIVTVHLKGDDGAPANGEDATVFWRLGAGGVEQHATVRTGEGGLAVGEAQFAIRTTTAGVYDVYVKYGDTKIPLLGSSPVVDQTQVAFVAGDPDPGSSEFRSSSGTDVLNDGTERHWAEVTVKDVNGNLVHGAYVTFSLDAAKSAGFVNIASGAPLTSPQILQTSDTGIARVEFTDDVAETVDLSVYLASSASGAAWREASFRFTPGAPSAPHSSFVITPDPTVAANHQVADGAHYYTGVVTLRDSNNLTAIAGHAVNLDVPASVTVTPAGPYATDANGQVTVQFSSTRADVYTVNALIGTAKIPQADQTITFVAGATDPNTSELTVTEGKQKADGIEPHAASVIVKDANGNPVSGQVVQFAVTEGATGVAGPVFSSTGQATASAQSCDPADSGAPAWCTQKGLARVIITSNEPGTFAVSSTLGGVAAKNSPKNIQFGAGEPDPTKSYRTVTPDTDTDPQASLSASGTDDYTVEATILSVSNIKVDGAAVRFRVDSPNVTVLDRDGAEANGGIRATGIPVSDHYGTYQWTVTSLKSGTYYGTVEVLVSNVWRKVGATVELRFTSLTPSADDSWLIQPTGSAIANNSATLPVKVRAYDINGNLADSGTVVFSIPAGTAVGATTGPNTVPATVVNGLATINVKATVAAVHQVTATIDGASVLTVKNEAEDTTVSATSGTVDLTFTAGTPSPGNSVLTIPTTLDNPPTKLVGGTDKHRAEVLVKDGFGNPVKNGEAEVSFSWSYTNNEGQLVTGTIANPIATDANGVASWEFGSSVATTWSITARVEGTATDVSGSPATAAFRAGALDPAKTLASFDVDSSLKKPNGLAFAWARMRAQDAYGNPLKDEVLGFGLDYTGNGPLYNQAVGGDLTTTATSGQDGWAEARIYSVWEGDFDAYGEIAGTRSSYKQVHFSEAVGHPDESRFRVEADTANTAHPRALANGTESYLVTVTLKDSEGNPVNGGSRIYFTPQSIPGATAFDVQATGGTGGNPTGVAVVPLTTLKAGVWKVEVKIGDDPVGTEADPAVKEALVEFLPLTPDAGNSKLISPTSSAKADGLETQVIAAELKDVNGNVTSGTVEFAIPAGVTAQLAAGGAQTGPANVQVATGTGGAPAGEARLVLTSTLYDPAQHPVTVYQVTAKVGGTAITDGSPARARFTNADLSAAHSVFTIPSATDGQGQLVAKEVVAEHHNPTVVLKDASGNVYTAPVAVTFSYRLSGATQWTPGATVTTQAGTAVWSDFTVQVAGVYEVKANIDSGQIPDAQTTRQAKFTPGPADAGTSVFSSSHDQKVLPNDTSTHYAQVIVKDRYGNVRGGDTVTFTLPAGDAAHFTPISPDCQAKSCVLISSDLGVARVLIAANSEVTTHVQGLLGANLVGEADLMFEAGQASASHSTWTITPATARVANGTDSFTATIQTNAESGLPKGNTPVGFGLPSQVRVVEPASAWVSDASGRLVVHFVSDVAGSYTVNALIGSDKITPADQQIQFVAGPISFDPDKTFLTSPLSSSRVGGEVQEVTATVRDAKDNPVLDAWVRFVVPQGTSLAPGASAEVQVDANGEAVLYLVSNIANSYQVTAQAKKGAGGTYANIVGGSPATVVFTNLGASLQHSKISTSDTGPKLADGLASYNVKVELFDQYGNQVKGEGKGVAVTFTLYQDDGSAPVQGVSPVVRSIATDANGVATTSFATTRAGLWKATATIAEGAVEDGSPLSLPFSAGAPNAGTSDFDVSKNNVAADGQSRHAAWVIVRDVNGNPVGPGAEVVFGLLDLGSDQVAGPVLDPADGKVQVCDYTAPAGSKPDWCDQAGKALVSITSNEPGSFRATATIGGTTVRGAPQYVSFDSGPPSAAKSSYTLVPDTAGSPTASVTATADGSESYTLTATIKSAWEIRVPNARVRLVGLDPTKVFTLEGGFEGYTGLPTEANYGTYTWHIYSPVAQNFQGTLQVDTGTNNWADISPAPFTLRFGADAPSASNSWLVQPVGVREADGVQTFEVKAHAKDGNGNDVTSGSVSFVVPAGLVAVVGAVETPGGVGVTVAAPIESGYARVLYKTVAKGDYAVTAAVGGVPVLAVKNASELALDGAQDGVVELSFTHSTVSAGSSELTIPTTDPNGQGTKVADGVEKHLARVVAKDANGNLASGEDITFEYGYGSTTNTVVRRTDANGVAEVEFASLNAVEYRVSAFVRGSEEVGGSPKFATFVPGGIDIAKTLASFWVNQTPVQADGVAQVEARVKVQDANGNGINGYSVGFRVSPAQADPSLLAYFAPIDDLDVEVSAASATVAGVDGIATVGVVSRWPGDFPVVAFIGPDESASKLAHFTRDAVSAGHSWFSVAAKAGNQTDPATADGQDAYTVTVNVRNPSNTPVNLGGTVYLTPAAGGAATLYSFTAGADGAPVGTAYVDVSTLTAGVYNVEVKVGDVSLATQPAGSVTRVEVVFRAGVADPGTSSLTGPLAPAQADGHQTQAITAAVRDANGNPLLDRPVVFVIPDDVKALVGGVEVSGPQVTIRTGSAGADAGVATLLLVSRKVGDYPVTATQDGVAVPAGAQAPVARFVNADLSLADSLFTVPTAGAEKIVVVEHHTPKVELFDVSGNVYTPVRTVRFQYRALGATSWPAAQVKDLDTVAGVAEWSDFTVAQAGSYEVRASVVGVGQVGQLITVVFKHGDADADSSEFSTSSGVVLSDDSAAHTALIVAKDVYGNLVGGAEASFELPVGGPAHFSGPVCQPYTCTVQTSLIGRAEVSITSGQPVAVLVKGFVDGAEVGSGTVRFDTDTPSGPHSSWTITPATELVADGVEEFTAVVTVRDSSPAHLLVQGAEVGFDVYPAGLVQIVGSAPYTTGADGTVTVKFRSVHAGTYTVNALLGSAKIPQADKQITFKAGPIVSGPGSSFIDGPDFPARVGGVEVQTVTATIRDANSNPVPNATVRFSIPADVSVKSGGSLTVPVDPSTGVASVDLVSDKAGGYQVHAEASTPTQTWVAITQGDPAWANFVAGPADASHSKLFKEGGDQKLADGIEYYTVRAELFDQFDNPVLESGHPVAFLFELAGQPSVARSAVSNASGVASTTFATTKAGTWSGTATYGGAAVEVGSPVSLYFRHLDPDPSGASRFEVTQGTPLADGVQHHTATATIRDMFGNPVPGVDVDFAVTTGSAVPGPVLDAGTETKRVRTDADGVATVAITSNEPGTFHASAALGAVAVNESPKQVLFGTGAPDPGRSSYTLVPDTAGGANQNVSLLASGLQADSYALTAVVRDGADLLVPGAPVRLVGLPGDVLSDQAFSGVLVATGSPADPATYGKFSWKLYSAKAGVYTGTLQVFTDSGWAAIGQPFEIRFHAGPTDPHNSWLVQPSQSATADGTAQVTVTAKLRDANGNPVETGSVVFHIPAGVTGNGVAGPDTAEVAISGGVASAVFTSTQAGEFTVTAGVKGTPEEPILVVKNAAEDQTLNSSGEVTIRFVSGAVSAVNSELTIPTASTPTLVGGPRHTAQVVVQDALQNPVSGVPVRFQYTPGTIAGPHGQAWTTHATLSAATSGSNGVAQVSFPADVVSPGNHVAQWIWVQAFVQVDGRWEPVGSPELVPAHTQALKGAEFKASGVVDLTNTVFETFADPVRNDLIEQSWARVFVSDQFGNGIPGMDVTLTLPAAQAGTLGTPVFVDGSTPPTAKTVTITTCAANLLAPYPPECLRDGVYTPGLAYVAVVSNHEGTFPVTGSLADGPSSIALGERPVVFAAGAGVAEASWFTLTRTNPSVPVVRADGAQSWTLTATVMNGETGAASLPVSGQCVTPQLPASVQVKQPGPAQGACATPGSFETDRHGQVSVELVSTVAGVASIGAKLGAGDIPTEAGGSVYTHQVLFVGGSPSSATTELTSPASPVRADDPAGQTVTATLRDQFGNLASCWDAGWTQIPCEVDFYFPADTWVGVGATRVNGPGVIVAQADPLDYTAAALPAGAGQATATFLGIEGVFDITAQVFGAPVELADSVRSAAGVAAAAHIQFTDATNPGRPVVNPSDGGHVDGHVDDGDLGDAADGELVVVVTDENGDVVTTCPVGQDGTFDCPISPSLPDGTELEVVVEDAAGNRSQPAEIVVDTTPPLVPVPKPTDGEAITGRGHQEGDTIIVKDADGNVLCTGTVGAEPGLIWSCELTPAAAEGDILTIIEEDSAHNQVSRPWRVGIPELQIAKATACVADKQVVLAVNFQPDEEITVTSGGAVLGTVIANAEGEVVWEWTTPAQGPEGRQDVVLTGPLSGEWSTSYQASLCKAPVPPTAPALPFTGADGLVGLTGAGLGFLLAGFLLVLAAKRRKREETSRN